ncbi:MAG: hypothetical protein HKO66_08235 [Saprospiraceae bacterium]|nr:hypothetical protein [Bacteroidia bacterium]NNE14958.1 hypothetical protein [Saprospiraceae bacterium]NNL92204.1 hypothetical protein [Saprospiraceae bacterium]
MKKLLFKVLFCVIVCLSCISYNFVQSSTSETSVVSNNITEISQSKDKMVTSFNRATLIVNKIIDVLAHRKN